ncbi:hypothetical protein AY599_27895 [Leptolyngbya valderiana BDU 20041]|nr:hypothetical protein AY599_27895 [Leptolyngbya valderiana BDU 20041]
MKLAFCSYLDNSYIFSNKQNSILIFRNNSGNDIVADFKDGIDSIALPQELLAEVQSRTAIATNVEGGALIEFNENTSVLLQNVDASLIEATDFVSVV